jgi:hypothetical protein
MHVADAEVAGGAEAWVVEVQVGAWVEGLE